MPARSPKKPKPHAAPQISIQSFYRGDVPAGAVLQSSTTKPGDGFTEEELADAKDPMHRTWNPDREYTDLSISNLIPGPKAVSFCGRVVNLMSVIGSTSKQPKATGWQYLIVKDDSGAIAIKLYFANNAYPIHIGDLVSCWTAFISASSSSCTKPSDNVKMSANMFPGRVTSDHIIVHTSKGLKGLCRTPLGYIKGQPLPELMTLESFAKSGHDGVLGTRLLVCVKSRGACKKIQRKDDSGRENELMDVVLMDHTAETRMTIWNDMIASARLWVAGETILLISNPGYKAWAGQRGSVALLKQSMVDLDPECADAEWLRKWVESKIKKEAPVLEFPSSLWDVDAAEHGIVRMYFTLAELDDWIRTDGNQIFTGFLNVIIMDMDLVTINRRGMLMCGSCCGNTLYSSTSNIMGCETCAKSVILTINPKILGSLFDETGCIQGSKLLWSPAAWERLFGRSLEEVVKMTNEEIRLFEQRVMFLRVHLCVGWAGTNTGRLAVLTVKM